MAKTYRINGKPVVEDHFNAVRFACLALKKQSEGDMRRHMRCILVTAEEVVGTDGASLRIGKISPSAGLKPGLWEPTKVLKTRIELRLEVPADDFYCDYPDYNTVVDEAEAKSTVFGGLFNDNPEKSVARFFREFPIDPKKEVINFKYVVDLVEFGDFDCYRAKGKHKPVLFHQIVDGEKHNLKALVMPMRA
jgi:hypothetical protein